MHDSRALTAVPGALTAVPDDLTAVPDDELLRRLAALLRDSRHREAELVAHIAEVDRRRLYASQASPSMFSYCIHVLHLSEPEAYLRITAARASRRHPVLLAMLADGRLHLSGIAKLAPHLTRENRDALLSRATHRSKRQIEELIAEICPRPDVPALMRKLPGGTRGEMATAIAQARGEHGVAGGVAGGAAGGYAGDTEPADRIEVDQAVVSASLKSAAVVPPLVSLGRAEALGEPELRPGGVGSARCVVEPLAPSRYKVQFTASAELKDKLERLQALLHSEVPDGDLGAIIDRAVTEKLDRLEARRYSKRGSPPQSKAAKQAMISAQSTMDSHIATAMQPPTAAAGKPGSSKRPLRLPGTARLSRHIPAAIRRAVHQRDAGRCRYTDETGRRCPERHRLEYHHLHPFGMGGGHTPENVRLMCRTHNVYLAEHDYGTEAMAAHRTG